MRPNFVVHILIVFVHYFFANFANGVLIVEELQTPAGSGSGSVVRTYEDSFLKLSTSGNEGNEGVAQRFLSVANPLHGCQQTPEPPTESSPDARRRGGVRTWVLLVNDLKCDLKYKIRQAAQSGYSALIVFSTSSNSPTPMTWLSQSESDIDVDVDLDAGAKLIDVSFVGYSDGLHLKSNYAFRDDTSKKRYGVSFDPEAPKFQHQSSHTLTRMRDSQRHHRSFSDPTLWEDARATNAFVSTAALLILGLVIAAFIFRAFSKVGNDEEETQIHRTEEAEIRSSRQFQIPRRDEMEYDLSLRRQVQLAQLISRRVTDSGRIIPGENGQPPVPADAQIAPVVPTQIHPGVRRQYSEVQLRKLPRVTWTGPGTQGIEDGTCSTCLEEYLLNQCLVKLPCTHYFHEECIMRWLTKPDSEQRCPLCRAYLRDYLQEEPEEIYQDPHGGPQDPNFQVLFEDLLVLARQSRLEGRRNSATPFLEAES